MLWLAIFFLIFGGLAFVAYLVCFIVWIGGQIGPDGRTYLLGLAGILATAMSLTTAVVTYFYETRIRVKTLRLPLGQAATGEATES